MIYCNKHRLPENHDCPFDLRSKNFPFDDVELPLYQDALEYMNKDLTVAKIYDYVTSKKMTKSGAIDLLSYFLENSDDIEIRKISIMTFKVLKLESDKAFNVLENYLLSEEDPSVKKVIVDIIAHIFPKKSRELLFWIRNHDKDFL